MDIQIRLATQEDDERIIEVQSLSLLSTSTEFYDKQQIESLVRSQQKGRSDYADLEFGIVAEYEHQIIGCGFCWLYGPKITGLYVHPDFKNRGIGTQLEQELEKFLVQFNYQTVEVISSLAAVEFYQHRGFELVKKAGFFSENKTWIPTALLRKNLSSSSFEDLEKCLWSPVEVCCQVTVDDWWQAQKFRIFSNPVYKKLKIFWNWLGLFSLALLFGAKLMIPILVIAFIFLGFKLYIYVLNRLMIKQRKESLDIASREFTVVFFPKFIEVSSLDNNIKTIYFSEFSDFLSSQEIMVLVHSSTSYVIPNCCFKSQKDRLLVTVLLKNEINHSPRKNKPVS